MTDTTHDDPIDGPQAWAQLALSLALSSVGSVGLWSVVVVLPAIQDEYGVDRADAAVPYTLTMVGFAAGNVLVGRYVDRFGIRLPVIAAGLTLALGYTLAASAASLWQFALVQGLVIGMASSATFGPLIASMSHWFRRRRGIAVAIGSSGNYLAGVIWPPLIQSAMASQDWRYSYTLLAGACISLMVPLAFLLKPRPDAPPRAAGAAVLPDVQPIDLSPRALQGLLVVAGVCCCVAMAMPQVHIVAYCADLGYGVARGAEMLSLMLAAGIVSRIVSGFLADRIGGVRTVLLGSTLQMSALFLYLPFDGLASLYVVSLIFGLAQGGIVSNYAIVVREYLPAREAGQRLGIVIMATVLGMALGGWMSGAIYDLTQSYQTAFVNGIAFNLVNMSVMVMILWRARAASAVPA